MLKNSSQHFKQGIDYRKKGRLCFLLLIISFLVGCFISSVFSFTFSASTYFGELYGLSALRTSGAVTVIFRAIVFHLVAFFLGTSFFGLAFIPVLSFTRGFALSCAVASIISVYPDGGIIMAAIAIGIPAIISLPCFFVISIESFFSSGRIFRLVRGSSSPRRDLLFARSLECLPFIAAGILIEIKLVPFLVSLLT